MMDKLINYEHLPMTDEPSYSPFRKPRPLRQPKPGELLFEFVRAR